MKLRDRQQARSASLSSACSLQSGCWALMMVPCHWMPRRLYVWYVSIVFPLSQIWLIAFELCWIVLRNAEINAGGFAECPIQRINAEQFCRYAILPVQYWSFPQWRFQTRCHRLDLQVRQTLCTNCGVRCRVVLMCSDRFDDWPKANYKRCTSDNTIHKGHGRDVYLYLSHSYEISHIQVQNNSQASIHMLFAVMYECLCERSTIWYPLSHGNY